MRICEREKKFQSLIGTLQTGFCIKSIKQEISFQSLIGTLQTKTLGSASFFSKRFQSLIGTLQTYLGTSVRRQVFLFQSLIGTLQTFSYHYNRSCISCVSIPYRYATNEREARRYLYSRVCFNPL